MMKHIVSLSGGKDSTAMLIKMIEMGMVIDDIVFINVMATPTMGAEFPEMYDYLDKLEAVDICSLTSAAAKMISALDTR